MINLIKKSIKNYNKKFEDIIYEAGKIAIDLSSEKSGYWYKSANQPVTSADLAINSFLKNYFKKITPEFGWLSEESDDDRSRFTKKTFWCVDPIDGTRSYINNKPEFVISLALIHNCSPIFGIIFNPKTDEMFIAERGLGAYCNKSRINVSQKVQINDCKVAISNSEKEKIKKYSFFNSLDITSMGSIAYKIALVAKGEIDIALSFTKKSDWDLAAANLILEESGGQISDIQGKKIIYNTDKLTISSVCASNATIHKKIINETK